jgi:hypothetical protein
MDLVDLGSQERPMWFLRRHRSETVTNGEDADAAVADAKKNLKRIKIREQEVSDLRDQFVQDMEDILHRKPKEGPI